MSSERYPLHNNGIYRNLPTFDPCIRNLTAVVTGANGISGFNLIRSLLDSPERWTKIYAISRRPPPKEMTDKLLRPEHRDRIQHIASDFLNDPSEIAQALKSASLTHVDYIFFYSYSQPSPVPGATPLESAQELSRVNVSLLSNFLDALSILEIKPRRFCLQTGAKNYGVLLGRIRIPAIESDPRVTHPERIFYYPQEDLLFEWCRNNSVGWNVIRPSWILGAVNNAQMNALYPFAVYAAVSAHRGIPLAFPSTWSAWQDSHWHATARLTGYLTEWAVLEDKCKDQAFNAQDTSPLSWDRLWEEFVRWFDVKQGFIGPVDDEKATIEIKSRAIGKESPMGYGPPTITKLSFSLVQWAKEHENQVAWKEIMAKNPNVTYDPFTDVENNFIWGDAALRSFGSLSMNKARRMGWTGFVDTRESLFEMYDDMAQLGMLPPMKVEGARAMM